MKNIFLSAMAIALSSTPVFSQNIFKCEFNKNGTRGWISSWAFVHIDKSGSHIFDGNTGWINKGAAPLRVLKKENDKIKYEWTLRTTSRNKQKFLSRYTMTFPASGTGKANMDMKLNNSRTQREFARGSCEADGTISKERFLSWAAKESKSN